MATPISELTAAESIADADYFLIVDSDEGLTKKVTKANLVDLAALATRAGSTTANQIPKWTASEGDLEDGYTVATSVDDPGVDTNLPTEKALRNAIEDAMAYNEVAVVLGVIDTSTGGVVMVTTPASGVSQTSLPLVPKHIGQIIAVYCQNGNGGIRRIVYAVAFDQAGHHYADFDAAGDFAAWIAIRSPDALIRWRLFSQDGVSLS